jgi:hypothetical protein
VASTLVGASPRPCGSAGTGAVRVYRANVTSLVPGNGSYLLERLGPEGVGASLVVVTSRPGSTEKRHVVIRAGAMTAQQSQTMLHAFDVFPNLLKPELHVGVGGGDATTEEAMKLGPFGSSAPTSSPAATAATGDDRLGVAGSVSAVGGQVSNSIKTGTDCLAWAYAGLSYTAA